MCKDRKDENWTLVFCILIAVYGAITAYQMQLSSVVDIEAVKAGLVQKYDEKSRSAIWVKQKDAEVTNVKP